MKKGRYRAAKALCPYYKFHENKTIPNSLEKLYRIYCVGVQPDSSISQSFTLPEARKEYVNTFCMDDYKACWICKAHMEASGGDR